jgi:hypothetical protein
MDDEVLREMTRDQLEGVAERAWRRANAIDGDPGPALVETRLRLHTRDGAALRAAIEPRLQEYTRQWRVGAVSSHEGVEVVEYVVQLRKKATAEDLLALVRAAGSRNLLDVELA